MNTRIVTTIMPYTELEVATGNYDQSRSTIDTIVLHTMVGTWQGAAARFDNPSSGVSAHYGVKYDGGLIHWLEETFTAYHSGNYPFNQRSIGIEHEDLGQYNSIRPDVLYQTSAKLVADICRFYSIPCDRTHVIRHNEVPGAQTACPDSLDVDRIVNEANLILNPDPCVSYKADISFKDKVIGERDATIVTLNSKIADLTTQNTNIQLDLTKAQNDLSECQKNLSTCQSTPLTPPLSPPVALTSYSFSDLIGAIISKLKG